MKNGHAVLITLFAGRLCLAETPLPPVDPQDALCKPLLAALDAFERGGRWKATDSSMLAWSCGQPLQTLVCLYETTGEREWLDRVFRYAEAMFANLSPNRDGFLGWRSTRYASDKREYDYAVHDGMVLMPVCRALELVRKDRNLQTVYGERAEELLRTIETQLIPKWDKYWRRTEQGGGVLVFQEDGTTMPHNQYLPMGTVQITLHRITGKAAYKERAAQMAAFFKSRLKVVDDHYDWRYWDDAGEWDRGVIEKEGEGAKRPEDTGHGSLDIGFVLACAENDIVFNDADLERFAHTFTQVMWNGSLDKPTVGGWVNTNKPSPQSGNLQGWLLLCRVEPTVRQICERVIPTEGSLWAKAQLYTLHEETGTPSTNKR